MTALTLTPQGLFSPAGGFHVDPVRPVPRAVITHGHSDHARAGHGAVLATPETLAIMAARYGADFARSTEAIGYGERLHIGDADVSLFPAGHVLGSAQVLIETGGVRAVVSGDYKRERDPTCALFEPIACDTFVTEATFGLPVFRHPPASGEVAKLLDSHRVFPERAHIVGAYSLGKAQRVIALIREAGYDDPIYLHGAMIRLCDLYREFGVDLGTLLPVAGRAKAELAGKIVLCPPSATQDLWARRFADPVTAFASGWMRVRARARQNHAQLPLIISDHADWDDLCATILETGASDIWVTHGEADALVHWCGLAGLRGKPLHLLGYGEEDEEAPVEEALS
jgi:putative mRNA 3-end processing factor